MQQRIISLGRMGTSMALRVTKLGCGCIVDGTQPDAVAALCAQGAVGVSALGGAERQADLAADAPTQIRSTGWCLR